MIYKNIKNHKKNCKNYVPALHLFQILFEVFLEYYEEDIVIQISLLGVET